MFALTATIVLLRIFCRTLYGRNNQHGGLGLDDFITIGCLLVYLATCILITIGSHYGLGKHYDDVPDEHLEMALKYNVIISSVLIWAFSLPKFAIIAILKRILEYGLKTTILFWGLALTSQACILATSVWWFVQCRPVEYGWNKVTIQGECSDVSILANLGYLSSAYSAFLDIFFALYPIPFIMRLNMPLRKRVAISVALSLSVLACVVSIYKLAIFGQVFAILATDPTYPVPYLDILGLAEGFVLLTAASLPTLGPIYRTARGKLSTAYGSQKDSANQLQSGSNNLSRSTNNSKWDKLRGHRLEDPAPSTGTRPSLDDIPLVERGEANHRRDQSNDIHKTVEISISSEALEQEPQRTKRAV
ncbi:putative integral membrane protein [Eutypa lata UCREL1]|uniref:Putative integral membrane protein n=1 Tax=Eutypa lata (strain UCR-EL1) TaxID=1287681 RepID=M7SVR5_EUTLA|nr:putative integral membrane protein [Eutypa lata UCREL1]